MIASTSAIALRQIKKSVRDGHAMALSRALAHDLETASVNFTSKNRVEGLTAFLDKREPKFEGH
jgi:enoyl-CoA hydratase/carnithine racemase